MSLEALITLQQECPFCLRKLALLEKGDKNFRLVHGLICFQITNSPIKVLVPISIEYDLIKKFHVSHKTLHVSVKKMGLYLKNVFFFKIFQKTAEMVVATCIFCQTNTPAKHGTLPILKHRIAFSPRKNLSLDIVHVASHLNNVVLTIVDLFSNFVLYIPIKKGYTALDIAHVLVERVFSFIGMPSSLLTDNEKTLVAPILRNICEAVGCRQFSIVPHRSTSQGLVERFNRLALHALRYFHTKIDITDDNLSLFCAITGHFLNSMQTPNMPASPYFLQFATQPNEMLISLSDHVTLDSHDEYLKHLTLFRNVYFLVREYHQNKMSKYDSSMTTDIKAGMFCLLRHFPDPTKQFHKLRPRYQHILYRIIMVFKKSLLVARFNDVRFKARFLGQGQILRRQCRRVRIEDVKILKNPSSFLKLSVPQKILSTFDNFLLSRTLQLPQDLKNTTFQQLQGSPGNSLPPLLKTREVCAFLSSGSLFNSAYFYIPAKTLSTSHSVIARKIRLRRKKFLSLPPPTTIDSEDDFNSVSSSGNVSTTGVPISTSSTNAPVRDISALLTPHNSSATSSLEDTQYETPQSLSTRTRPMDCDSLRARTSRSSSLFSCLDPVPSGHDMAQTQAPLVNLSVADSTVVNPLQHPDEFISNMANSNGSDSESDTVLDQRFETTTSMEDLLVFSSDSHSDAVGVHFIPAEQANSSVKSLIPIPFSHKSVSIGKNQFPIGLKKLNILYFHILLFLLNIFG